MLHHVSLEVDPADRDRFCELLGLIGFERIETPEELGGGIPWFERAGTQVHLIVTEGHTAPLLGHAAFAVGEWETTIAAVEAAGFEVEPTRELWGVPRSFVLAPGGHRIELMAAPPEPSAG